MKMIINFFKNVWIGFKGGHQSLKIVWKNKKLTFPVILLYICAPLSLIIQSMIINSISKPKYIIFTLLKIPTIILTSFLLYNVLYFMILNIINFTKRLIIDNYKITILKSLKESIQITKKGLFWIVTTTYALASSLSIIYSNQTKLLPFKNQLLLSIAGSIIMSILWILFTTIFTALVFKTKKATNTKIFYKGMKFTKNIFSQLIGISLYMTIFIATVCFIGSPLLARSLKFIVPTRFLIYWSDIRFLSITIILFIISIPLISAYYCFMVKKYKEISKQKSLKK